MDKIDIIVSYVGGDRWKLRNTISLPLVSRPDVTHVIPRGFKTDFASIPRVFWSILPPFGKYILAAIVHDHMYKTKHISRKFADTEFLMRMARNGVPYLIRNIMYLTVRAFGWLYWK